LDPSSLLAIGRSYTHTCCNALHFDAAENTARKFERTRLPDNRYNGGKFSSYAECHVSEMTEWEFLNEVVEVLLRNSADVTNLRFIAKHNFNPYDYVNSVPPSASHKSISPAFQVRKISSTPRHLIDPVWKLYIARSARRSHRNSARMDDASRLS